MKDLSKKIILKPWGYEYSVFNNKNFCIWLLYIKENESTSLHCHPNKTTKLILLDGEAKINYLSEEKYLKSLNFISFDQRQFHSTRASSKNGIYLLEVESSSDKDDLVRLFDKYGRENKNYEFNSFKFSDTEIFSLNTNLKDIITYAGCYFKIYDYDNFDNIPILSENLVVIMSGQFKYESNNDAKDLLQPGDVLKLNDFFTIIKKINYFSEDCKILLISKECI